MKCEYCGNEVLPFSKKCEYCGSPVNTSEYHKQMLQKTKIPTFFKIIIVLFIIIFAIGFLFPIFIIIRNMIHFF